jgi:metal-responsive CopG/Arc/MetJ family transcriptional regulator
MEQVDERISVRFDRTEVKAIDAIIKEYGYPSRSEFFRTAVRSQVKSQEQDDAVSVRVTPLALECIDALVDRGYYKSREHAVQLAIDSYFTEDNVNKALRATEGMEIVAGKKIEVNLESPSRHITTK